MISTDAEKLSGILTLYSFLVKRYMEENNTTKTQIAPISIT